MGGRSSRVCILFGRWSLCVPFLLFGIMAVGERLVVGGIAKEDRVDDLTKMV